MQIPSKQQLPAPKCVNPNVANSLENENFQLRNVAKIVEMAASSSKMLQIAKTPGRKNGTQKTKRTKKKNKKNLDPFDWQDFNSSWELKNTSLEANRHEHTTGMKS